MFKTLSPGVTGIEGKTINVCYHVCIKYAVFISFTSKTNVLPLTKRQGVFFQSLTAAFNCYNLQYLLAIIVSLHNVGA